MGTYNLRDEDVEKHGFNKSSFSETPASLTFYRKKIGLIFYELHFMPKKHYISLYRIFPNNNIVIFDKIMLFDSFDLDFILKRTWQYQTDLSLVK